LSSICKILLPETKHMGYADPKLTKKMHLQK